MVITEVTFSRHAIERMEERLISETQVRRTILHPDRLTVAGNRRIVDRKTDPGKTVRVIYTPQIDSVGVTAHVITVYWTKGV